jgi:uncharacterized membrane protein
MQCIKCKNVLPEDASTCPNCGSELLIHRSFDIIKNRLGHINSEASSLSAQITQLQKQITNFENLISKSNIPNKQPAVPEGSKQVSIAATTGTASQHIKPEKTVISSGEEKTKSSQLTGTFPQENKFAKAGEFEIKFGQKWLLIAGVIFSVLAVGWFLKFSFDQNWVGPTSRVILAYVAGLTFIGVGEFFRRKNFFIFGLYIIGGGLASLYFATFAAFQIYHLLPQAPSFLIMILVTVLAGTLALVYDTKWLAVLGIIGGFLTPIVLGTEQDNQTALMTYMVILNSAILIIAFFKQWRLLNYLGFVFTWFLFSVWYFSHYEELKFLKTIIFLNIFFLTYALVPFVYYIFKDPQKRLLGIGMSISNSFFAFAFSYAMIKNVYQIETTSIVSISYAIIFLCMSRFIYNRNQKEIDASVLLLAKAMFFLALTIPILFAEHWVTFFWTIQAAVIFWAAIKIKNQWLYISVALFLVLSIIKLLIYDYDLIFQFQFVDFFYHNGFSFLLIERILTESMILMALFLIALMSKRASANIRFSKLGDNGFFIGTFVVLLFLFLNIEVAGFFYEYISQARSAAISVLWTIFSIVMIAFGFLKNQSTLRKTAIGLFVFTMIKVFVWDMSNVSTPYRIISFLVLGLMLISASYLYHRFKDMIIPADSEEIV